MKTKEIQKLLDDADKTVDDWALFTKHSPQIIRDFLEREKKLRELVDKWKCNVTDLSKAIYNSDGIEVDYVIGQMEGSKNRQSGCADELEKTLNV